MTLIQPWRLAQGDLLRRIRRRCKPLSPLRSTVQPRIEVLSGIRVVLFDVYGTLLVSLQDDHDYTPALAADDRFCEAVRQAGGRIRRSAAGVRGGTLLQDMIDQTHQRLKRRGIDQPEVDIRRIWRATWNRLVDEGLIEGAIDARRVCVAALEYECSLNPVWPMPGAAAMLTGLRQRGLRLGLVSNAQYYTPLILQALFRMPLRQLGFSPALCAWSWKRRVAKPSLALLTPLLDRLRRERGIPPSQVLVIGNDVLNDVRPAHAQGCRTALFAGDRHSTRLRVDDSRCAGLIPDRILTRWDQLLPMLGRSQGRIREARCMAVSPASA